MHIAVECVGTKHSGGAAVLLDFLKAAVTNNQIHRITVFMSPRQCRRFDLPHTDKIKVEEQVLAERHYWYRLWWYEWGLQRRVKQIRAGLLVCINGAGRGPEGTPVITLVQQALPLSKDGLTKSTALVRTKMAIIGWLARRSCLRASQVIVQTPTMLDLVVDRYGVARSRVVSILPSPPELPSQDPTSPRVDKMRKVLPGNRVLYVGNTAEYKNVTTAVTGMSKVRTSCPLATLFGTWAEPSPWMNTPGVIGLGFLDGPSLVQAYSLASLLVMPSLVETVGFPMLEAMDHGVPVLAADRAYAHDVCGDAALFFDPLDPGDFAEKVTLALTDASIRQTLIRRGKERVRTLRGAVPYEQMVNRACELVKLWKETENEVRL